MEAAKKTKLTLRLLRIKMGPYDLPAQRNLKIPLGVSKDDIVVTGQMIMLDPLPVMTSPRKKESLDQIIAIHRVGVLLFGYG